MAASEASEARRNDHILVGTGGKRKRMIGAHIEACRLSSGLIHTQDCHHARYKPSASPCLTSIPIGATRRYQAIR